MLEPVKIMESVISLGSIPGGIKRIVVANLAVSETEILGVLVAETLGDVEFLKDNEEEKEEEEDDEDGGFGRSDEKRWVKRRILAGINIVDCVFTK